MGGAIFRTIIAACVLAAAPMAHAQPQRIASLNLCTDQLLLALVDPAQILGLGPYSRDTTRSWSAADAHRYPRLSGEAEDVLEDLTRDGVKGQVRSGETG